MTYQQPPLTVMEIAVPPEVDATSDDRPVTGLMQPFLGRRMSPQEIFDALLYIPDAPQERERVWVQVHRVRAFEVQSLIGITFDAMHQNAVGEALGCVLRERLPGIVWEECTGLTAALQKYQFLHTSIAAPLDETTGQAMALEIYGSVVRINGIALVNGAYGEWRDARRRIGLENTPLTGHIEIRLAVATYANVCYPSVGVPFYL